jgi:hypothetical protein
MIPHFIALVTCLSLMSIVGYCLWLLARVEHRRSPDCPRCHSLQWTFYRGEERCLQCGWRRRD